MSKKKVFISWSGPIGRCMAEGLRDTLLEEHPEIEGWVSTKDIHGGDAWFGEITKALDNADYGVACLTPGASKSTWLSFEAGYAFGRLNNLKLLRYPEESITGPLAALQSICCTEKPDLVRFLREITTQGQAAATAWVNYKYDAWRSVLNELDRLIQSYPTQLTRSLDDITDAVDRLEKNPHFQSNNVCFQHLIIKSLRELPNQISIDRSVYSAPATEYPHYLISLQTDLNARVKAVALVDQEEHFWQQQLGREIWKTSHRESARVFVFANLGQFERAFETLVKYAGSYDVYAMSAEELSRDFSTYDRDFSIIEAAGSKILAIYDDEVPSKTIRFIADPREIGIHEEQLDRMIQGAEKITSASPQEPEHVAERIFKKKMTAIRRGPIEMSEYIQIELYHMHEEKHAYFVEMMQRMIDIFLEHRGTDARGSRVLEFGAGTGIFTKRLARIPEVDVVAVEIDSVCVNKLRHNLIPFPSVQVLCEDSRDYNPPGKFHYIFSSFADHHIKPTDKPFYFQNVRRNLMPGGLFIVGDEFLRPHDQDNEKEWQAALEAYHNHIIEIAEKEGATELVELEKAALKSGLMKQGDFKISCEQYESILRSSGFEFKKEKIGPKDRDDLGGIYVYTAWVPA